MSEPKGSARAPLRREELAPDPISQFRSWFDRAQEKSGLLHPNAACLSTVDPEGRPEGRIVLLKGLDSRGLAVYTNLESAKAMALEKSPEAALTFHWEALGRQVRVQGSVEQVDPEEADAYFRTRPRGSQLGAWASQQSRPLDDRSELEERMAEVQARFQGKEVPRPPFWGGYRVVPRSVEFWQEGPDRLHDRLRYQKTSEGDWEVVRLNP